MNRNIARTGLIVLVLILASAVGVIATETTWRHAGFELWGYDINVTGQNITNVWFVDFKGNGTVPASASGHSRIWFDNASNKMKISENSGAYNTSLTNTSILSTSTVTVGRNANGSVELTSIVIPSRPTFHDLNTINEAARIDINKSGNNYTLGLPNGTLGHYYRVNYTDGSSTSANDGANAAQNNVGYIHFFPFFAAQTSDVTGMALRAYTAAGNVRVALYSDSNNVPGTLLVESASVVMGAGYSNISVTPTAVTLNTKYWMAWQVDSNTADIYYLAGSTRLPKKQLYTYSTFPATTDVLTGTANSSTTLADPNVLSYFKRIRFKVNHVGSTSEGPTQVDLFGSNGSYARPMNPTKFNITSSDPNIWLLRKYIDAAHDYSTNITASSTGQTTWNMTVLGGMSPLTGSNHDTILATEIGVGSVLAVEKSLLGDWTDNTLLAETDYDVDSSTKTHTWINLTSGTGIVDAQSKLRITWIADVLDVPGATNNATLKARITLNRETTSESTPVIELLPVGSSKYMELLYS